MQKLLSIKSYYQQIKELYDRYERLLMPSMLVVGFLVDYITFTNIKINTTITVFFIYWILAGATIAFIHLFDAEILSQKLRYIRLFAPLLIQYTFGALLGGSFIFYWFSGSLLVSWPLILVIIFLMVSNDVFRRYLKKPIIQVSVYFFITLSLLTLILPFIFNSLSVWLFIAAGLISAVFIYIYIKILSSIKGSIKQKKTSLLTSALAILLVMNFFYFANIIPPVPLSIRDAGVYHNVQRSGGSYVLQTEEENFWQKIIPGQTIHLTTGERAYVFTSIFAPVDLNTTIIHHWQYRDENGWQTRDKLSFVITGGRREGYRGYSWKSNLTTGSWRVRVETDRGQVLGTVNLKIERPTQPVQLQEVVK